MSAPPRKRAEPKKKATPAPSRPPLNAYISYSNRDRELMMQLVAHLRPLEQDGLLTLFYDTLVDPGELWSEKLFRWLSDASMALFLVSPESLSSQFIARELELALVNNAQRRTPVIPILLRPCDWYGSRLAKFNALPSSAKPVTTWENRDEAFLDIARGIRRVAESLRQTGDSGVASKHSGRVQRIAVTPDGRNAVSVSEDSTVMVWDLTTTDLRPVRKLTGHTAWITDVEITPDAARAITASQDGTIRVWELESGRELRTIQTNSGDLFALALTPSGVISASGDSTMRLWDPETGERRRMALGGLGPIFDVVAIPGALSVVSAHAAGVCGIWSLETGTRRILAGAGEEVVHQIALLPPDYSQLVCGGADGTLWIVKLDGTYKQHLKAESSSSPAGPVFGVAPLPDGRHVVSASQDGLKLWDLATATVIRTMGSPATAVAVTPDGSRAVWGSQDGSVAMWTLDTSVQRQLPEGVDRLHLAYLAVLEMPELWRVLETWDESALSGIGPQLRDPPPADVLEELKNIRPNLEPPALWSAWMQTVFPSRLRKPAGRPPGLP